MRTEDRFLKRHGSGTWYYRRRVPQDVRPLVGRSSLELSLKTKNLDVARLHRDALNDADSLYWASLMGGSQTGDGAKGVGAGVDPALAR